MLELRRRSAKALRLVARQRWRRALFLGAAAAIEHRGLLSCLNPKTLIDVGANVGQFSLLCRELFPDCRIFAFEPLRDAATTFRRVFEEDSLVVLFEAAIGPQAGKQSIYVSKRADSSSLLPITGRQEAAFPGTGLSHVESVNVAPLGTFVDVDDLEAPVLLKLDVQGFELQALEACNSILESVRWVYVECSYTELYSGQALEPEIRSRLESLGFRLRSEQVSALDELGRPLQVDALYERS